MSAAAASRACTRLSRGELGCSVDRCEEADEVTVGVGLGAGFSSSSSSSEDSSSEEVSSSLLLSDSSFFSGC